MKKIIILTLLSAFFIAGLAVAQPGHGNCKGEKPGNMHDGMPMILKMADKLELTDKQTEQIEAMSVDFKLQQIEIKAEIKKEQVLMKALMRNDNVSEREVFDKIDKIAALKADSKKLKFSHKNAVQSVLTVEQLNKLKELRKNSRFAGRRGGDCDRNEFGSHNRNFQGKPCDGDRPRDGSRGFRNN